MDPTQPIEGEERLPRPAPTRPQRRSSQVGAAAPRQLTGPNRVGKRGIGNQDTGDFHTNVCSYMNWSRSREAVKPYPTPQLRTSVSSTLLPPLKESLARAKGKLALEKPLGAGQPAEM